MRHSKHQTSRLASRLLYAFSQLRPSLVLREPTWTNRGLLTDSPQFAFLHLRIKGSLDISSLMLPLLRRTALMPLSCHGIGSPRSKTIVHTSSRRVSAVEAVHHLVFHRLESQVIHNRQSALLSSRAISQACFLARTQRRRQHTALDRAVFLHQSLQPECTTGIIG